MLILKTISCALSSMLLRLNNVHSLLRHLQNIIVLIVVIFTGNPFCTMISWYNSIKYKK